MLLKIGRSLARSKALRATAVLGGSGVALAVGNLLLARFLPAEEFALFSLLFSLVMVGVSIGPVGADVILTRHRFVPDTKLHRQILLTSTLTALLLVAISIRLYPIRWGMLGCLAVSVVAGALKTIPVAYYRSQQRFGTALMLTVSTNFSVMVAAILVVLVNVKSALWPAIAMSATLLLTGFVGWRSIASAAKGEGGGAGYAWGEGIAAVAFAGAGTLLTTIDRLVIPEFLGLATLATFSVLSTIAGSPFHMLHLGIGYTLLPALRNASSRAQRLRVVRHEGLVVAAACLAAAIVVIPLTPYIVKYVLADRYQIGTELVLAAIVGGCFRVAGSLMAAVVNALGSGRDLARLSVIGAIAIAISFLGAAIGSRWDLVGLVYGVSAGWLFRAMAITALALPRLLNEEART